MHGVLLKQVLPDQWEDSCYREFIRNINFALNISTVYGQTLYMNISLGYGCWAADKNCVLLISFNAESCPQICSI